MIEGYTLKFDKIVLDPNYTKPEHQHDYYELEILKKYKPKYFIGHQFFTYLGVIDLKLMLTPLLTNN